MMRYGPDRCELPQGATLDCEGNVLAGELAVDAGERLELVLEARSILRIKRAADELATVRRHTNALRGNLGREHKVLKDGVLHGRKRAAARPRLLSTAVRTLLRENAALANEHDVVVRELLLKLAREAKRLAKRIV